MDRTRRTIAFVVAVAAVATMRGASVAEAQRDPGINQPGVAGNRGVDPGINQPGVAGNVGRDPGINQPGAAGNVGRDPGINQPGPAGNRGGIGR
jgi:hypothetical protein